MKALDDAGVFSALLNAAVLELPEGCTWIHPPYKRYLYLRPDSVHMLREVLHLYEDKKHGVVVTCAEPVSPCRLNYSSYFVELGALLGLARAGLVSCFSGSW